jgi:hypothetical protein
MLHKYVTARGWDDAIRLCRFVKDEQMWACLAVMAAGAKELNAAEIAYVTTVLFAVFVCGFDSASTQAQARARAACL